MFKAIDLHLMFVSQRLVKIPMEITQPVRLDVIL